MTYFHPSSANGTNTVYFTVELMSFPAADTPEYVPWILLAVSCLREEVVEPHRDRDIKVSDSPVHSLQMQRHVHHWRSQSIATYDT